MSMSPPSVVVAIDLGTTFSGYAFSTAKDFKKDPAIVYANQIWTGTNQVNVKCPTCILLDQKKDCIAFGFEAKEKFKEVLKNKEQNEYYFFEKFKMNLYSEQVNEDGFVVEDVSGKPLKAETVFIASIKVLSDHFKASHPEFQENMISWVLTVPTIWSEAAKNFMRQCGKKAGLGKYLCLAHEPETAAVYCWTKGFIQKQQKFLLVDIGGGTTDTVVQEVLQDGQMKNICIPCGEKCGGTDIDNAFLHIFRDVMGTDMMLKLKKDYLEEYSDLQMSIEEFKKKSGSTSKRLQIPIAIFNSLCLENTKNKNFIDLLGTSKHAESLKVCKDKLEFKEEFYLSMFKTTIKKIESLIQNTLEACDSNDVDTFYLVGGLSESSVVQNALKEIFPGRVQTVKEASTAVLKGAVTYGHKPDVICSRLLKYTYGIASSVRFDPTKHHKSRAIWVNGVKRCSDTFHQLVSAKTRVSLGEKRSHTFKTIDKNQEFAKLRVYYSPYENPEYIDDNGCKKLAEIKIDLNEPSNYSVEILVDFEFGNTEIKVVAHKRTKERDWIQEVCNRSLDYSIKQK